MIFGIGTDIVSYSRISRLHQRYDQRFAQRVLSAKEWPNYNASGDPVRFLMKRFVAKEAFAKAIGTGLRSPVTLQRICIEHDTLGKPILVFDKTLAEFVADLRVTRHHISISDERDSAVAFVVLEQD